MHLECTTCAQLSVAVEDMRGRPVRGEPTLPSMAVEDVRGDPVRFLWFL